jgi:hypothetical protein
VYSFFKKKESIANGSMVGTCRVKSFQKRTTAEPHATPRFGSMKTVLAIQPQRMYEDQLH